MSILEELQQEERQIAEKLDTVQISRMKAGYMMRDIEDYYHIGLQSERSIQDSTASSKYAGRLEENKECLSRNRRHLLEVMENTMDTLRRQEHLLEDELAEVRLAKRRIEW